MVQLLSITRAGISTESAKAQKVVIRACAWDVVRWIRPQRNVHRLPTPMRRGMCPNPNDRDEQKPSCVGLSGIAQVSLRKAWIGARKLRVPWGTRTRRSCRVDDCMTLASSGLSDRSVGAADYLDDFVCALR